ncbi:MAG: LPS-assembly protein LptD, partial [Burkholderiales bacterium]|nr:LPS-assembly protein LptD [Burkholderiales bacterium]
SAPAAGALRPSLALRPLPRSEAAALPTFLRGRELTSQPDATTFVEGDVDFRRAGLAIHADRLSYDAATDLAAARGHVRIRKDGAIFSGPEMQLQVQRFEGWLLHPEFEFPLLGVGGRAERVDFLDAARSHAIKTEYTSCPRVGNAEPAWVLRADSVELDTDRNEGVAHKARLDFLGVPILALPTLSFPLSDARRSGWLPPTYETDNRSGLQLSMPYYWNIAPNRDATFTPRVITRRGFGLDSEFRYLEPGSQGQLQFNWLPDDRLTGTSRDALQWRHETHFDAGGLRLTANVLHVSDDNWWKDFPNDGHSLTPRLLQQRLALERPFSFGGGSGLAYARLAHWQVLQDAASVVVEPYERSPQIGVRVGGKALGLEYRAETEYNHFELAPGALAAAGRTGGDRVHLLGSVDWPLRAPGWFVVPKFSVNAAAYGGLTTSGSVGRTHASRAIPTFSLDLGLELERQTVDFGRSFRQTLEPRMYYVWTPYLAQSQLPNFDSAGKDFNFTSIYTDNQFSGIDRVSDAKQLTTGVITRYIDNATGAEALRLGYAQRYLFSPQRITAQADGTPDGNPEIPHFSDALVTAATSLIPAWKVDSTIEYSPAIQRSIRSIVGLRYEPGPFRTLSMTYRLQRGSSEQLELGWQWPITGRPPAAVDNGGSSCGGAWYGVGRVNYSLRDRRVTDSVVGTEYDAGCWILRVVARSVSTGLSQATTGLMVQLELVGLSRIGSNPLQLLKDNIPGYRLLREERNAASPTDESTPAFYD